MVPLRRYLWEIYLTVSADQPVIKNFGSINSLIIHYEQKM